mmetsp:Transcript_19193/g.57006  ORF Transcript_19193/g.57006 Transcript_19193/m.57006 type:complete len:145 (+) Transcript_19193:104-538(+)|eukprot:356379-Chlamydomonas_euryale.AAC.6
MAVPSTTSSTSQTHLNNSSLQIQPRPTRTHTAAACRASCMPTQSLRSRSRAALNGMRHDNLACAATAWHALQQSGVCRDSLETRLWSMPLQLWPGCARTLMLAAPASFLVCGGKEAYNFDVGCMGWAASTTATRMVMSSSLPPM